MGFSRQEYWSGLPFPSPGDLPDPGIKPRFPALQADALTSEPPGKPFAILKSTITLLLGSIYCYSQVHNKYYLKGAFHFSFSLESNYQVMMIIFLRCLYWAEGGPPLLNSQVEALIEAPTTHLETGLQKGKRMCAKSLQSCLTLCNPMDCRSPGSSVHGILQARILEWVAMPSSRGSSQSRGQTHVSYVSCIGR